MAAKKRSQQKDHEFSLSSGQMVGIMVGLVVIVLMAFVVGLLIGRYETQEDFAAMQKRANETERTTVSLDSAPPKNMSDKLPAIELPSTGTRTTTTTSQSKPKPKPVSTTPKPTPKPVKPAPKPAQPAKPKVTPPAEKPKEPAKPSVGKYGIQVSASSSKPNADEAAAKLKKEGYDAWVRPPVSGSRMHGIMVGRFATKDEANASELFKEVKAKKEFAEAWIP